MYPEGETVCAICFDRYGDFEIFTPALRKMPLLLASCSSGDKVSISNNITSRTNVEAWQHLFSSNRHFER